MVGIGMLAGSAHGAEHAFTVRPTDLKATPFSDAANLARLAESVRVDVLERKASWMQVKADNNTGWVKMLSLRFEQSASVKGSPASGANALYNVATTGSSGSTATTGVKGIITAESLKNARPNTFALQQMQAQGPGPGEVRQFAKAGKLAPQRLDYVSGGEQ
ncbi:hypothetical protein C7C56_000925 [Massilia glaciei]|uniref:SH3 domain-containing protein n=1 Tax=Massilia glaciei TaxID=1524097 RepID=A0A2U2I7A5_9BURK|nr:hypothetical protein C7C56_000925 [Massilia glaciei]